MQVSLQRIPNYLRARSPQGLRRAMLLNNSKTSTFFQYFDIQHVADPQGGYWYAWYFKDVNNDDIGNMEAPIPEGSV